MSNRLILHIEPSSDGSNPLFQAFQTYWQATLSTSTGPTTAQSYRPHTTVTGYWQPQPGSPPPHEASTIISQILQKTADNVDPNTSSAYHSALRVGPPIPFADGSGLVLPLQPPNSLLTFVTEISISLSAIYATSLRPKTINHMSLAYFSYENAGDRKMSAPELAEFAALSEQFVVPVWNGRQEEWGWDLVLLEQTVPSPAVGVPHGWLEHGRWRITKP
ncbi:hypothetical protein HK097_009852 [Rhizophlyctis rosea]|uniref:Uncharacterized protein n=1 Tax=Rhizophlyctis rosea TaxID=64517 RepID=A0AAD5X057_9FUNG|nr:hypothetical protein HK097_009852 [Rhizophlyctis rosea]